MRGRLIATAATAAALALAPAAGVSAAYPPTVITCTLNIVITQQGIIFTITCEGFLPGATGLLTIASRNPATPDGAIQISGRVSSQIRADAQGTATANVTLTAPGVYDVSVTEGGVTTTQTVVVPVTGTGAAAGGLSSRTSAAAGTAAGGLSATGGDVLPLATGAAAVLLVGTGAVVVARQRRRAT
ncbi:hypothetical protein [Cellulomonas sp. URHB0016]